MQSNKVAIFFYINQAMLNISMTTSLTYLTLGARHMTVSIYELWGEILLNYLHAIHKKKKENLVSAGQQAAK